MGGMASKTGGMNEAPACNGHKWRAIQWADQSQQTSRLRKANSLLEPPSAENCLSAGSDSRFRSDRLSAASHFLAAR